MQKVSTRWGKFDPVLRGVGSRGGGGGGDSNMKMPGCVCQESENVPILNDTFSR